MELDFIMITSLLPLVVASFLSLALGYLFLVGSSVLPSMVVQQLVVILVLLQRRRANILLLCHLELEASFFFLLDF